ncbi:MAG: peptide-methionine (S)-S-oxide reductase MsrA [Candidatus Paceibacterota bacterium]
MKTIFLGAGGFWTLEAIYKKMKGVEEVVPGYMGGTIPHPSHEAVATGTTGHIEVVKLTYDDSVVSDTDVLHVFYAMHDTATQQYPPIGIGSQYRSVIFYTEDMQAEALDPTNGEGVGVIQRVIEEIQSTLPEGIPVSTQIMSAGEFYPAEEYHYRFYENNPDAAYSTEVIAPQLDKVTRQFPSLF